ncbi:uncharacterized protein BKA78DRAFT_313808 [Phyllosticta capitalensis]|uniref:uncharacterized protein n=1 Tax=Phyllosticta capitalensis TaxID=121624 RepID=UPI00312E25F1
MEYEGRHYKGKVATFTGRVSWVSFDSRLTLYAASLEAPRCWYNGWRKNPSIETKKEILENLLQEIECSHMDSYGKAYKTRFMKKYCDRALCQPAPEDSPQFYGWDNDSDDGNDTPIVRNGIIYRSQRRRCRSEGAVAGGRARSWAPGSGFDNGSGQAYTYV